MLINEKRDPSDQEVLRKMIAPLRAKRFTIFPGQLILKLLTSYVPHTISDLRDLQSPITSLITLQPEFVAFMQSIHEIDHLEIIQKCKNIMFLENMNSNVVHMILRKLINTDDALDLALVSLRRALLQYALHHPESVDSKQLQTMVTIASQVRNKQYALLGTADEEEMCRRLMPGDKPLDSDALSFVAKVVAYAMYHPLHALSLSQQQMQVLSQHGEYVEELIDRQAKIDT